RGISRAYEEAAMGKDYPLDDGPLSRCTGAERISLAGGRARRSRRRRVRAHACGHDRENPGGRLEYWTFELVIPTRVAVPSPFGRYTGPPESPTRIPVYPSQRVPLRCPHLHRAPSGAPSAVNRSPLGRVLWVGVPGNKGIMAQSTSGSRITPNSPSVQCPAVRATCC